MAGRTNRRQAARLAVLAFVAADCAGIYYVQHRMEQTAAQAEALAYAEPLGPSLAGPPATTFTAATPALALAVPAALPAISQTAAPVAVSPAAAASQHLAVAAAPAPVQAPARVLPASRPAPSARQAPAHLAAALPLAEPAAPVRHKLRAAAPSVAAIADGTFANAFSLYDEAPDTEHRFGQGEDHAASGTLADLVAPREDAAPMFEKAGIAPVAGQAATVDTPAVPEAASPDAGELPVTKG